MGKETEPQLTACFPLACSRDDLCAYLCFVLVSPFVSLAQTDRQTQTHVSQRLLGEEPSVHSFWVNIPTLDFICVSALSCFWNTGSGVGSPEPMDIWQPNAGPAPRGGGQKDGTDWAREEGRQRAEARGPGWDRLGRGGV